MKYQKPSLTKLNDATSAIQSMGVKVNPNISDGGPARESSTALAYEVED